MTSSRDLVERRDGLLRSLMEPQAARALMLTLEAFLSVCEVLEECRRKDANVGGLGEPSGRTAVSADSFARALASRRVSEEVQG